MKTVTVVGSAEWQRILEARAPSPLFVTDDHQWFVNGRGTTFQWFR